jgi:hypothetical protein
VVSLRLPSTTYELHVEQMLLVPRIRQLLRRHLSQVHSRFNKTEAWHEAVRRHRCAQWVDAVARLVHHKAGGADGKEETSQG